MAVDEQKFLVSGPTWAFFLFDAVANAKTTSEGLIFGKRSVCEMTRTTDEAQEERYSLESFTVTQIVVTGPSHSFYKQGYKIDEQKLKDFIARSPDTFLGWYRYRSGRLSPPNCLFRAVSRNLSAFCTAPLLAFQAAKTEGQIYDVSYQPHLLIDGHFKPVVLNITNLGDTGDERNYWSKNDGHASTGSWVDKEFVDQLSAQADAVTLQAQLVLDRALTNLSSEADRLLKAQNDLLDARQNRAVRCTDTPLKTPNAAEESMLTNGKDTDFAASKEMSHSPKIDEDGLSPIQANDEALHLPAANVRTPETLAETLDRNIREFAESPKDGSAMSVNSTCTLTDDAESEIQRGQKRYKEVTSSSASEETLDQAEIRPADSSPPTGKAPTSKKPRGGSSTRARATMVSSRVKDLETKEAETDDLILPTPPTRGAASRGRGFTAQDPNGKPRGKGRGRGKRD